MDRVQISLLMHKYDLLPNPLQSNPHHRSSQLINFHTRPQALHHFQKTHLLPRHHSGPHNAYLKRIPISFSMSKEFVLDFTLKATTWQRFSTPPFQLILGLKSRGSDGNPA